MSPKSKPGLQISWTTVTYRSVLLFILGIVVLLTAATYFIFPEQSKVVVQKATPVVGGWLEKIGITLAGQEPPVPVGQQYAHFTVIDGSVKVKKASNNAWVSADYNLPLEKGDVVQTTSEGLAKVVFADNTSYTVKQDSLIVIQDNSTNAAQQTQVAVQLTTGTVDLTTATYSQGSKSQVIVAGATASLAPDSSALVRNDPKADEHEILVKKGSGEVSRGGETVKLSDFEKVTFTQDARELTKTKEVGPPTLVSPMNMAPIYAAGPNTPIDFAWTPVSDAKSYRLRISRNPYFSSLVLDTKMVAADFKVTGLAEGPYYWSVQAIDAQGRESVESEKNRFTIIPKGNESVAIPLDLQPFIQHGHVLEIKGKTEAEARVMVNGREVPVVFADGSFQFFTPPLPTGENVITVTAQNSKGGVKTEQRKIVIQ